ncbi:MAG: FecR domain-containing protein [Opitutaceae bacterium]|nr:FecR domain-containing protein [Opitutaceae bacterium]
MSTRAPGRFPADIESVASRWILRRDAGMTADETAEFARWRTVDRRHADAVARKDEAWSALGRPLQSGQADVLLQRLRLRAVNRRRRVVAAAAGVAALLFAGLAWTSRETARLAPPVGRGVVLLPESRILPDGSVVELRFGAEVATDFGGPERRVTLVKGEAHFQVAKNKERPFVVTAGAVQIRAIGTAFAVELGRHQVEVLVTEGRVAVQTPSADPTAGTHSPASASSPSRTIATLDAGSGMVVDISGVAAAPAAAPIAMPASQVAQRLAWRVPRLEFSEVPLGDAAALMNRYNQVQFTIEDPAIARLLVSGLFRADNLDTFVRLLEGTCGVKAERSGDIIKLRKAE